MYLKERTVCFVSMPGDKNRMTNTEYYRYDEYVTRKILHTNATTYYKTNFNFQTEWKSLQSRRGTQYGSICQRSTNWANLEDTIHSNNFSALTSGLRIYAALQKFRQMNSIKPRIRNCTIYLSPSYWLNNKSYEFNSILNFQL